PYFIDGNYRYFISNGCTTYGEYTAEVIGAANGASLDNHPAAVTYQGKTYKVLQTADDADEDDGWDSDEIEGTTWQDDYAVELDYGKRAIYVIAYFGTDKNICIPAKAVVNGVEYKTHLDASFNTLTEEGLSGFFAFRTVESFSLENGVIIDGLSRLFFHCDRLKNANVSDWNTSNIRNMSDTFNGCSSLSGVDIKGWNVKNVFNVESMFCGCSSLKELDLSGWDMGNVTRSDYFFEGCSSLQTIRTPRNLRWEIPLPGRFIDSFEDGYDELPQKRNDSILLTRYVPDGPDDPDDSDGSDDTEDSVRAFVERMYTKALNRPAEQAGLDHWVALLRDHSNDGAGLAYGFICSQEFKNRRLGDAEYVEVLYHTFFDRDPDAEGYADWMNRLRSGYSREYVLSRFVNSQEFDDLCESYGIARGIMNEDGSVVNPGIRRFVERLYTKCLGRAGEKDGIDYWVSEIVSGSRSAAWVAREGFFFSPEYLKMNKRDIDFIVDLYHACLDREPDSQGLNDWFNRLHSGGDRKEVIYGFTDSQEFYNLLMSYGLL
ncbi:MAG: DUF4214 domain-containing protein, partial [Lachnospiraceae bacterium]|nr:DUF4214 domain-containing protein [Lachnospiraceae bacterium]